MNKTFVFITVFSALTLAFTPHAVHANPTGGTVAGGRADIASSDATLNVTQYTNKLIVNWRGFDIAAGETTNFIQPSSSAIALNRVTSGTQASRINGTLSANGRIILVNPNGALFGSTARVNVGSLVASSAGISDGDFLNGNGSYSFADAGSSGAIVSNAGQITVGDGGIAALVAPQVSNSGIIQGNYAKIALGAGDTFGIDFFGDGLISIAAASPGVGKRGLTAENSGTLTADGGRVLMTAATATATLETAVNTTGHIRARRLERKNGVIILSAGDVTAEGDMEASGNIEAKAAHETVLKGKASAGKNVTASAGTAVDLLGAEVEAGGSVSLTSGADIVGRGAHITARRGITAAAQRDTAFEDNSLLETAGGAVTLSGGHETRLKNSIIGTRGGNVTLSSLGQAIVDLATVNATGGTGAGDITVSGRGFVAFITDAFSRFYKGEKGGTVTISGESVRGSQNCIKAGGAGSCAGYADPAPEDLDPPFDPADPPVPPAPQRGGNDEPQQDLTAFLDAADLARLAPAAGGNDDGDDDSACGDSPSGACDTED